MPPPAVCTSDTVPNTVNFVASPTAAPSQFASLGGSSTGVSFPGSPAANLGWFPGSHGFVPIDSKASASLSFSPYLSSPSSPASTSGVAKVVPLSAHVVTPLHVSYPYQETKAVSENQIIIPLASSHLSLLKISEICENSA